MDIICKSCGTKGKPVSYTKGYFVMELFLWLLFIIPGLIYTMWRITTRQKVCRVCRSTEVIPLNTPVGKKTAEEFSL